MPRLQIYRPRIDVVGPQATHDMPCAVFRNEPAVLDMTTGVFRPSRYAQRHGWRLVRAPKRWQRVLLRLIGCLEYEDV